MFLRQQHCSYTPQRAKGNPRIQTSFCRHGSLVPPSRSTEELNQNYFKCTLYFYCEFCVYHIIVHVRHMQRRPVFRFLLGSSNHSPESEQAISQHTSSTVRTLDLKQRHLTMASFTAPEDVMNPIYIDQADPYPWPFNGNLKPCNTCLIVIGTFCRFVIVGNMHDLTPPSRLCLRYASRLLCQRWICRPNGL